MALEICKAWSENDSRKKEEERWKKMGGMQRELQARHERDAVEPTVMRHDEVHQHHSLTHGGGGLTTEHSRKKNKQGG